MTLYEVIKHCEEVADKQRYSYSDEEVVQITDWLKELKRIKDAEIIKKSTVENSRMEFIKDEKKKKIAEFLFDYAYVDDETVVVPIFRVLDALIQDGEPYSEG
jgi:hypothetical protein